MEGARSAHSRRARECEVCGVPCQILCERLFHALPQLGVGLIRAARRVEQHEVHLGNVELLEVLLDLLEHVVGAEAYAEMATVQDIEPSAHLRGDEEAGARCPGLGYRSGELSLLAPGHLMAVVQCRVDATSSSRVPVREGVGRLAPAARSEVDARHGHTRSDVDGGCERRESGERSHDADHRFSHRRRRHRPRSCRPGADRPPWWRTRDQSNCSAVPLSCCMLH